MGLAFAARDGSLTCDKQGRCISLQHVNRQGDTAYLTPPAIPACTGAERNKALCHCEVISFDSAAFSPHVSDVLLAVFYAVYPAHSVPALRFEITLFPLVSLMTDKHPARFSI